MNWNVASIPDYGNLADGVLALKTETLASPVRPYAVAIGTIMTPEAHDALHSEYVNGNVENTHTFYFAPVLRDPSDVKNSDVVAVIGGAVAWDRSLLNLLPTDVRGILTVIKNNCNQSYTYEIDGHDAFFVGEGDLHEPEFSEFRQHGIALESKL